MPTNEMIYSIPSLIYQLVFLPVWYLMDFVFLDGNKFYLICLALILLGKIHLNVFRSSRFNKIPD